MTSCTCTSEWGEGHTAQASVDEVHKVLRLMDLDDGYKAARDSEYPLPDGRIGGGMYPEGGFAFNLLQDFPAANVVMPSTMPVRQIPIMTCKQTAVTLAERQAHVYPCGEPGKYLVEQMAAFNNKAAKYPQRPHGEIWGPGGSPTVSVLLEEAPVIDKDMHYSFTGKGRKIRVCTDVNPGRILGDFFARMKISFGS